MSNDYDQRVMCEMLERAGIKFTGTRSNESITFVLNNGVELSFDYSGNLKNIKPNGSKK